MPIPDLAKTDFVLLIGTNPEVANLSLVTCSNVMEVLRGIFARDGTIHLLDPRRNETAKSLAREPNFHHYFIRPDTDIYLLLQKIFNDAQEKVPAVIIINDIDIIARDGVENELHDYRIVSQLIACLDSINAPGLQVMVIGTTSRIAAIDPSLRRPGRFEVEIELKLPSRDGRKEILQIQTRGLKLATDVDLNLLAEQTEGFSGAHLAGLVREAARHTVRRAFPGLDFERPDAGAIAEKMELNKADLAEALINMKNRFKSLETVKK